MSDPTATINSLRATRILRIFASMKSTAALALAAAVLSLRAAVPLPGREINNSDLDAYFQIETHKIAGDCLARPASADEWRKSVPRRRAELAEMLGLSPMPPRTDLKATVTGRCEQDTFTVENLHFQSLPGLYVTANLY